jgi:hypothetical protein
VVSEPVSNLKQNQSLLRTQNEQEPTERKESFSPFPLFSPVKKHRNEGRQAWLAGAESVGHGQTHANDCGSGHHGDCPWFRLVEAGKLKAVLRLPVYVAPSRLCVKTPSIPQFALFWAVLQA